MSIYVLTVFLRIIFLDLPEEVRTNRIQFRWWQPQGKIKNIIHMSINEIRQLSKLPPNIHTFGEVIRIN